MLLMYTASRVGTCKIRMLYFYKYKEIALKISASAQVNF
jgi:hypothetical protein